MANKAIENKVDDKTGAKGIGLGTKRCIRLGARKIKLEIRQLETKRTIRLEPRAKVGDQEVYKLEIRQLETKGTIRLDPRA